MKATGRSKVAVIFGQTDGFDFRFAEGRKFRVVGDGERFDELAHPVAAMIEKYDDIAVFIEATGTPGFSSKMIGAINSSEIPRRNELRIAETASVRALAFGMNEHRVGAGRSFPILLSVHRVITPAERRNFADADVRHFYFERLRYKHQPCAAAHRARRECA